MKYDGTVAYRLHCLTEDGEDETEGYFFKLDDAKKRCAECEEEPQNKKYKIKYSVEHIRIV